MIPLLTTLTALANPIVNGQTEEGFPSTVAIGAEVGSNVWTICSANLITPRLALTAAHCSAHIPIEAIVDLGRVFVGTESTNAEYALELEDALEHPDYVPLSNGGAGTLGENDFALLWLAEDAPVQPSWLRLEALDDSVIGETVTSVGYGITDSSGRGSGTKRSAPLTIDELEEMFIVSYSDTNENEANICSGDSGGPQFYVDEDGRQIQWAVHSWGDQYCMYSSGSTRVDMVADWLLEHIEATHGTTDLCEINSNYSDGLCDQSCDSPDPDCLPDLPDPATLTGCAALPSGHPAGTLALPAVLALLGLRRRD